MNLENLIKKELTESKSIVIKQKLNEKKKMISATNSLSRFSYFLLFAAIICIILISIYPMINIIITFNFISEFTLDLNELLLFYNIKSHTVETYT